MVESFTIRSTTSIEKIETVNFHYMVFLVFWHPTAFLLRPIQSIQALPRNISLPFWPISKCHMTQAIYSLLWASRLAATSSATSDKMCLVKNSLLYAKYLMQVSRVTRSSILETEISRLRETMFYLISLSFTLKLCVQKSFQKLQCPFMYLGTSKSTWKSVPDHSRDFGVHADRTTAEVEQMVQHVYSSSF